MLRTGHATNRDVWSTPRNTASSDWIAFALVCLIVMHAVNWTVTHPVNEFWVAGIDLPKLGARFFVADSSRLPSGPTDDELWTRLRNRWESSHIVRAVLAACALLAVLIAIVS